MVPRNSTFTYDIYFLQLYNYYLLLDYKILLKHFKLQNILPFKKYPTPSILLFE